MADAVDIRQAWKETVWDPEHKERDEAIGAGIAQHVESEDHKRPRGLIVGHWTVDSGLEGTALVATPARPLGYIWKPMPSVINQIRTRSYPAGTFTVVVKYLPQDQDESAGVTLLTFSHTGQRAFDDTFEPITVPPKVDLVAYLTAAGTVQVASINVEKRRT